MYSMRGIGVVSQSLKRRNSSRDFNGLGAVGAFELEVVRQ